MRGSGRGRRGENLKQTLLSMELEAGLSLLYIAYFTGHSLSQNRGLATQLIVPPRTPPAMALLIGHYVILFILPLPHFYNAY